MWCFTQTSGNSDPIIRVIKSDKSKAEIAIHIFKTHDFQDDEKSLDRILKLFKEKIIEKFPENKVGVLEAQGFLEHKNAKWYQRDQYFDNVEQMGAQIIKSSEILDIAIATGVIKPIILLEDLLYPTEKWLYALQKVDNIETL